MTRSLATLGFGLLGVVIGGCIDAPYTGLYPPVQCETTSECDAAAGEICDEGVCWGDPPSGLLAAVLGAPADRSDLDVTELVPLAVTASGWAGPMVMAAPITVSGRVMLECGEPASEGCSLTESIAAQIVVTRESRIPGGPRFYRTASSTSGLADGDSFTLQLPRLDAGEAPYQVVVIPDDGRSGVEYHGPTPAAIAPPLQLALDATSDAHVAWKLGDPSGLKQVSGRVVNGVGAGLAGFEVVALAKWSPLDDLQRGSTVALTAKDGSYTLRLPIAMTDVFDVVATPRGGAVAPVLRAHDLFAPDPTCVRASDGCTVPPPTALTDLRMPSYPTPTEFRIPVDGYDSSGVATEVIAAEVSLTTTVRDPLMAINQEAIYSQTVFTGSDGIAVVELIPGGPAEVRRYKARIRPPAGTQQASLYDAEIEVGVAPEGNDGNLAAVTLSRRELITGTVVDFEGRPVSGATVSAQPSLKFSWGVDDETQRLASALLEPSAITDDHGAFFLWVDPMVGSYDAEYELEIEPPSGAWLPRWSVVAADADAYGPNLEMGDIWLPAAAFVRGNVVDAGNQPIADAEVRILEVVEDQSICDLANVPLEGAPCAPPAILHGLWHSDANGVVRMVLPDIQ